MKRAVVLGLIAALVLLFACNTGPGTDLRLFAERFNDASHGRLHLDITQFMAEETEIGLKYTAFVNNSEMIAVQALPNGRIHTVSVTALPDMQHQDFFAASMQLLQAFAEIEGDEAERVLQEIYVGNLPVLGLYMVEHEGFRLSYAANEAGRYFRVSCLRQLPTQPQLPTLRERITPAAN